jgi:hypothetical protein
MELLHLLPDIALVSLMLGAVLHQIYRWYRVHGQPLRIFGPGFEQNTKEVGEKIVILIIALGLLYICELSQQRRHLCLSERSTQKSCLPSAFKFAT